MASGSVSIENGDAFGFEFHKIRDTSHICTSQWEEVPSYM